MALLANTSRFSLVFALAAAGVTVANAQSVNQLSPIERLPDVVQFGVPRDAKFVFCDGEDCPERSIKHLHIPPPPLPMPQPQSVQMLTELSRGSRASQAGTCETQAKAQKVNVEVRMQTRPYEVIGFAVFAYSQRKAPKYRESYFS
ncbi:unnamed protein product (plasmid) [Mycetohabitans rhizoxinica HKI 454]|uniref:Secreted protein n=1 Tax=Mycetohabitans rhizoxinica (strain DSM 19002 / CIP 109453 / HKI 454) TaxID=882378 RepID=E5AVY9_MYCRK|nr:MULTISPECIES: hypothetical protein [Mycetohabitans]CBW77291.1 unnamed protein product [Mycetohabitans rhizoxinica HKI 454]